MNKLKPRSFVDGSGPVTGQLLSFLAYARTCTLSAVENCTQSQLDILPPGISNSVGTLLRHIAALEFQFQQVCFHHKTLDQEQMKCWYGGYAGELALNYVKYQPLSYYTGLLHSQREKTLEYFKSKNDEWLQYDNPVVPKANNLFFWYHLAEDELCHTGQIKLILKMAALENTASGSNT